MIIVKFEGGLGNQLFQYAAGCRLAHKLGTELKFDLSVVKRPSFPGNHDYYRLDKFNVREIFATPEEIAALKNFRHVQEGNFSLSDVLSCPDNVYLEGFWQDERYFADIADIIRREFTLKNPLGAAARYWQEKISAAQCSVSIHVRHGDYLSLESLQIHGVLPLNYYRHCVDQLKQLCPNLTVFVFSDNLNWCRKNFHFGVPTKFVAGEGLTDAEELHLMSLCKHNVIANSSFSWWAAWLNQNPDKKVFAPDPWFVGGHERNTLPAAWTKIPVNHKSFFNDVELLLSIIVYVRNNAATLQLLIASIFSQGIDNYELILIDDGSDDGSEHLCRKVASNRKVTLITSGGENFGKAAAWNVGLNHARGEYVMFLTGDDIILPQTVTLLLQTHLSQAADMFCAVQWFEENPAGNIIVTDLADKKFARRVDEQFKNLYALTLLKSDDLPHKLMLMGTGTINTLLGTKFFRRDFLLKNSIRFNENAACDAELPFVVDAVLFGRKIIFTPDLFYIAPKI